MQALKDLAQIEAAIDATTRYVEALQDEASRRGAHRRRFSTHGDI